ncbi:hypothetical protein GCM10020000_17090 [Streptomyces olivoverticillatus]
MATGYLFEVVCTEPEEAHVRTLVVQAVARPDFLLRSVHSRDADTPGKVIVSAGITTEKRDDSLLEEAVSRLSLELSRLRGELDGAARPGRRERRHRRGLRPAVAGPPGAEPLHRQMSPPADGLTGRRAKVFLSLDWVARPSWRYGRFRETRFRSEEGVSCGSSAPGSRPRPRPRPTSSPCGKRTKETWTSSYGP